MIKSHEILATVGTWKDAAGATHKRQIVIGAAFETKAGGTVLKIDAMPTSPSWSGWLAMRRALPPSRRHPPGWPQDPAPEPDPPEA